MDYAQSSFPVFCSPIECIIKILKNYILIP